MPYYDTITEDLARAKEILEKGAEEHTFPFDDPKTGKPFVMRSCAIYPGDTYAAYKLLESFVEEIERLQARLEELDDRPDY